MHGSYTCNEREHPSMRVALTFNGTTITTTTQRKKQKTFASIPYIPAINSQLKRALLSNKVDFHSKPWPKHGNLLSSPNKTQHPAFDQKASTNSIAPATQNGHTSAKRARPPAPE